MNINEAYQLVEFIAQKDRKGYLSPDKFNLLAAQGQWEVAIKIYMAGWPMDTESNDKLLPLLKSVQVQTNPLKGTFVKPADYWHISSLQYKQFHNDKPSVQREFKELDNNKFTHRLSSVLVPPTVDHPIFTQYGSEIKYAPVSIGMVQFDYLRMPRNPYWDYDIINEIAVYKASGQIIDFNASIAGGFQAVPRLSQSLDFDLPPQCHNDIVMCILQHMGVNIDNAGLTQYANAKQQQYEGK